MAEMLIRIKPVAERGIVLSLDGAIRRLGRGPARIVEGQMRLALPLARALAPYDPTHRGWTRKDGTPYPDDPGHIRDNIELIRQVHGAALMTTHPGGLVHEFGGVISPAGHPIRIAASHYAEVASETVEGRTEGALGDWVEDVLESQGL